MVGNENDNSKCTEVIKIEHTRLLEVLNNSFNCKLKLLFTFIDKFCKYFFDNLYNSSSLII